MIVRADGQRSRGPEEALAQALTAVCTPALCPSALEYASALAHIYVAEQIAVAACKRTASAGNREGARHTVSGGGGAREVAMRQQVGVQAEM